jgi:sigma-B regulation protein RsbU (phosphoserine phosphatase)
MGRAHHPRALRGKQAVNSADGLAHSRALQEQMASLLRQRDELQRVLGDAAQAQRKFNVPRRFRHADFEIAGESFPAQYVSGDLLSVLEMGEHILFALGDICGKGMFAGMWFTHLAGLIRVFAGCHDPAQMAEAINSHLAALPKDSPMATLFLGWLHTDTGELTYCNAGHPAPLLLRSDGQADWLDDGGPLLGAVAGAGYSSGHTWLAPGEVLVAYSDGVVECRNRNGEDFDAIHLAAATRQAAHGSAGEILFSVLGAAQDFAAAQPRADDLALMVVRRFPGAASEG